MDDFNAVNKKYHENIWLQNVLIPLLLKDLYRYNENGGSSFATLMKTNINDEKVIQDPFRAVFFYFFCNICNYQILIITNIWV